MLQHTRSVDASEALAMGGVVAYVSAEDVPGSNITADGEELFVTEQVCVIRAGFSHSED